MVWIDYVEGVVVFCVGVNVKVEGGFVVFVLFGVEVWWL